MVNDMHKLFDEINKFKQWASTISEEDKSAEWECDYCEWSTIWTLFSDFIINDNFLSWNIETVENVLYIIARDNEMEELSAQIAKNDALLLFLSEQALIKGEIDTKWQMAAQLQHCNNRQSAERLLERYVIEADEYVNRRALMSLGNIKSEKTEVYCKIAWERNVYGNNLQEYQRMAVLHSLFAKQSNALPVYITLAKQDGRKYLIQNALEIEAQM